MAVKRLCSVDGCGNPHDSHGFCGKHARRFKRHGDPLGGGTGNGEPDAFINQALAQETNACIIWPYAKTKRGYAQMGDRRLVSRIICERSYGPPPSAESEAAHSCGKGHAGCINKRHLRWATHLENVADRATHGTNTVGHRNPMAKLTERDVIEIRHSGDEISHKALAEKFGVSVECISAIVRRLRWKHL